MPVDQEKLAKLQQSVRIVTSSGKGTPRRKKVHKPKTTGVDDKKLQATLKKVGVQPITGIEEVNMFKQDGNVIHFSAPRGASAYFSRLAKHSKAGPIAPKVLSSLRSVSLTYEIAVQASLPANTFSLYGNGEDKELTELVPGILNQLGPDSLASLRKLAESYQSMQKEKGGENGDEKKEGEGDDDIPDLVEGQKFGEEGETVD
ncbi:MAG: hypothetical protein Q9162_001210 [Coniocarpon cinnabarinum]